MSSNKEVFEALQKEFRTALLDEDFMEGNKKNSHGVAYTEVNTSIVKLPNKHNKPKKQWRQRVDRAKNGTGLDVEKEPKWFQILHQVLSDTNAGLEDISSGAMDTSFVLE